MSDLIEKKFLCVFFCVHMCWQLTKISFSNIFAIFGLKWNNTPQMKSVIRIHVTNSKLQRTVNGVLFGEMCNSDGRNMNVSFCFNSFMLSLKPKKSLQNRDLKNRFKLFNKNQHNRFNNWLVWILNKICQFQLIKILLIR